MADFDGEDRRAFDESANEYVTHHQSMAIAQSAGIAAAKEVLEGFGIYASTPEARAEYRKDMEHVRDQRKACASVKSKAMLTAVGIVATSVLAMVWMGFSALMKTKLG